MSGSTTVAAGTGYRPPFTPVQWQELEHQALIYKYLVAGVPVPYDLVVPIRRSLEALSATFFNNPNSLGYCSYYGKKFDPEPGRCRRTDGKKWRCAKDAYPDSKYCERHMHRGRNRSRKPVESQSASQSLSTRVTAVSSTGSGNRSYQNLSNGTFQNSHLYPTTNSGTIDFGSNASKLQVHASSYGINNNNNNNFRYDQGLTINVDDINYSSGASSARAVTMESNADSSWCLVPKQISSTSLMESRTASYLQTKSPQLTMVNAFEPVINATTPGSKPSQQHCLFGSKIESPVEVKHEQQQHMMRPFFDEWPEQREPWSSLEGASGKNSFSTTQLSMSTAHDYSARNDCTPNDD
ncbi:putative transcription factor interactor and regulator C3H-WRC/GRF family [Helianthus annuus]|uniref:Growth-regulating factor n=1 Tax=Helianthus annuus TaxID=4232 RepID=A0A251V8Y9_HELAN|nr:growth-regulating factor 4 [Helianthus annuus]KAF5815657.1 putative transcription factor interactor and regulator C3H-WRC/GRF family [Helianthus annuus]KAJ0594078.1 putative transcription factor interactor and regulator C3H-WRC/GRF family [Helianthus annuus]KAJ0602166.1 putative transcription factor interactor and regulator C3H-WRC/GRF family [Helianthus annuus]KAJ0609099.1 putative transcription factor interactor and regulator C3H-WRC/GRF family [Helianthus annuus]KAJ0769163.1 putative tra